MSFPRRRESRGPCNFAYLLEYFNDASDKTAPWIPAFAGMTKRWWTLLGCIGKGRCSVFLKQKIGSHRSTGLKGALFSPHPSFPRRRESRGLCSFADLLECFQRCVRRNGPLDPRLRGDDEEGSPSHELTPSTQTSKTARLRNSRRS